MSNQQGTALPSVELLAPAGGAEALHAAVAGGADAVYLGLDAFNARRNADNFTLETLGEACDYAHLRGVRVYVTLNTAILPSEVDRALECARQAYRAGADAFIVQDVGVAAELARSLPQARLHISTQMNTHNAAGIEAAAKLGARRVTLARELSLAEVEHLAGIASDLGLEVEAFAHGALCVCYSGQCFMSSMIGGRSANRGPVRPGVPASLRAAQPRTAQGAAVAGRAPALAAGSLRHRPHARAGGSRCRLAQDRGAHEVRRLRVCGDVRLPGGARPRAGRACDGRGGGE